MIDINSFTNDFLNELNKSFDNRIFFVGLQGSYGRGEATEKSDIDLVVILDELTADDISVYNKMLDTLPHRELICGFLSGKNEILNWEPADLFQFYYDTTALYGSLDELLSVIDKNAVERAIKIGACNIYHGCVHNMLYEKNEDILRGLYKSASFVIQAVVFKQTGKYFKRQNELLEAIDYKDRVILNNFKKLRSGEALDFTNMSEDLLNWAKRLIITNGEKQ